MTLFKKHGMWNSKGSWSQKFKWFLVDDGALQYAFKTKAEAQMFQSQGFMNYMLLTDLEHLTNDTMLDANDPMCWATESTCMTLNKIEY